MNEQRVCILHILFPLQGKGRDMTTPDMSRQNQLQVPPHSDSDQKSPDRLANIEKNIESINKAIGAFGAPMLHPEAPTALKSTIVAALRMQGKYKQANELEGTKEEEGFVLGYIQMAKQWKDVPLTPQSQLKTIAAVTAGAAALDFVLDMADASLPRTGVLSYFKNLFGGSSKKR